MAGSVVSPFRKPTTAGGTTIVRRGEITDQAWEQIEPLLPQQGGQESVNEALFPSIPPNMFVTCFYAILDPQSGSLTYANASHDLPYLWHGSDAEELSVRGMPLGLMPGMSYEQKEIELDAAEGILFYSDGLAEAHNPKGEMSSFPRLRAFVAEHGEERWLEKALLEEIYSFTGKD
jgi:serine phosphatase RsbU (regulator of sigma subunit)